MDSPIQIKKGKQRMDFFEIKFDEAFIAGKNVVKPKPKPKPKPKTRQTDFVGVFR